MKADLKRWNCDSIKNIGNYAKDLQEALLKCQHNLWFNLVEEKEVENKLDLVIQMKENFWCDKSRDLIIN